MTTYRKTQPLAHNTSTIYAHLHTRLTNIAISARRGEFSAFQSVNSDTYAEARKHLTAIEDTDGEALNAALGAAGKWLAAL